MATDHDGSAEIDKQELLDAIAERLEPLLGRNQVSSSESNELFELWSRLESKLHQDDFPDVSAIDARRKASEYLVSAGLNADAIDNFIKTCMVTGASSRMMCAMAVEWANNTL